MAELVLLESVTLDPDLQPRVAIDQTTVDEYAEEMKMGEMFPPIIVFDDGETKWLADGWHRYLAAQKAGLEEINADLRNGSRRDALLFSISANAKHGLRRSRDDKKRAVMALLSDHEWSKFSDRELAKLSGVTHPTIAKYRAKLGSGKFTTLERESQLSSKVWEFFDGERLRLFENFEDYDEAFKEQLIVVGQELEKTVDHLKACDIADLRGGNNRSLRGGGKAEGFSYLIKLDPHPAQGHFWTEVFEFRVRLVHHDEDEEGCYDEENYDDDGYREELCEGAATAYKRPMTLDYVALWLEMERKYFSRGPKLSDFTIWSIHESEPSFIPPFRADYPDLYNEWEREHYQDAPERERLVG